MKPKNVKLAIMFLFGLFTGILYSEYVNNRSPKNEYITQPSSLYDALKESYENQRKIEEVHQKFIDDLVKSEMNDTSNYYPEWFIRLEIEQIYKTK